MILKGSQRGGAKQLAIHLLRTDDNDHVELHELRGFVADDLAGALHEAYAVSRGTHCQQFLFSVSLSPPETEQVSIEAFEAAIDNIEAKLALTGQPRVVVFHEKQGRRHAHCVWSRIDAEVMRAINLPHFKLKLRDVSRELYIKHGWRMPLGLVDGAEADPLNFTRAEWQQAKRAEKDPRALKTLFQYCWAISDSRKAFAQALAARGFYLAQGDRRSFVAVDIKCEVYAVAKWTGLRTNAVRDRLGDPADLPTVADTKIRIAGVLKETLGRHLAEAEAEHQARAEPLVGRKSQMIERHREDRNRLRDRQATRAEAEAIQRAARFRTGIRGLWDRLVGKHTRTRREIEAEADACLHRDQNERQAMIDTQLYERRRLHREIAQLHAVYTAEIAGITADIDVLEATDRIDPVAALRPHHRPGQDLS